MKFAALIVLLVLATLPVTANVVKVVAQVDQAEFKGACPHKFTFSARIRVDAPGEVTYRWLRSDGAMAPVQKLVFRKPRQVQIVTTTWTLGGAGKSYEEWQAVEILTPNSMTSNRAAFKLACDQLQLVKPIDARVRMVPPGGLVTVKPCIDPAAFEVRFDIVQRHDTWKALMKITGVVKNVGNQPFVSDPRQAVAYLYELPPGATTGGTLRAQKQFGDLPVGGTVEVSWEREWNSSSPSEGEFPPSYRLLIGYDPDIYMDANKQNDDCDQSNNSKTRSGMDINSMLH